MIPWTPSGSASRRHPGRTWKWQTLCTLVKVAFWRAINDDVTILQCTNGAHCRHLNFSTVPVRSRVISFKQLPLLAILHQASPWKKAKNFLKGFKKLISDNIWLYSSRVCTSWSVVQTRTKSLDWNQWYRITKPSYSLSYGGVIIQLCVEWDCVKINSPWGIHASTVPAVKYKCSSGSSCVCDRWAQMDPGQTSPPRWLLNALLERTQSDYFLTIINIARVQAV